MREVRGQERNLQPKAPTPATGRILRTTMHAHHVRILTSRTAVKNRRSLLLMLLKLLLIALQISQHDDIFPASPPFVQESFQ